VGLSFLTCAAHAGWLDQRLTGVLPAYRRRGIALALKVRGLAYARDHGYDWIKTDSAVQNTAMRGLNRRLGFVEYPAWVFFRKTLAAE
jgi:GNAT superfamily N-acetyltransferase